MIARLRKKLTDPETSVARKHRALFALKNMEDSDLAHSAMMEGLRDASTLFRHEVAYCLGQMQNANGIRELVRVLSDVEEHPMVRHEAAEALGAISTEACVAPLEAFVSDDSEEVRQTCLLALWRIGNSQEAERQRSGSVYRSVDPTPALTGDTSVAELEKAMLDEGRHMFDRYKAIFALRNLGSDAAVQSLSKAFGCRSALLKHEVAFVLGQIQNEVAVESLAAALKNVHENPMVRHEAAEALGSIADDTCVDLLKRFTNDPEPIVAESCLVALDLMDYEHSGALEYVDNGDSDHE